MRKRQGRLKKLTKQEKQRRQRRDERKPKDHQRAIRLWAHQHIKGER